MKRLVISALSATLVTGLVYGAYLTPRTKVAVPQSLPDINSLILDMNALLPGVAFSWSTGQRTSIATGKAGFVLVPRPTSVDNLVASAQAATCSGDPVVQAYECGTDATCASPTVITTVTLTSVAAGTAYPATIVNPTINAGDYIAFATSGGTCSASNITVNMMGH